MVPAKRLGRLNVWKWLLVGLACILWSPPLWASRSDVVILKNGDRITCSVKELNRGKLKITTDHMGTIYVDWLHVHSIEASKTYEIKLADGSRYYGSLVPGSAESSLAVRGADATDELVVPEIVRVIEIKSGFLKRLDGSVDFGFNFQKTNSDVNYSLRGDVSYRAKTSDTALDYRSILSYRSDVPRTFRNVLNVTHTRYFAHRWQATGLGKVEQNDELGLDLRTNLGAVFGRRLIQTNRSFLSVMAGLTTNREQYVLDPEATTSLEGMITTSYDFFVHGDLGADISAHLTLLPSLTESGRYRVELDVSYRHEIVLDLYISFSGWYSFDNKAPVTSDTTVKQDDYGLVTSLGWKF